MGFRRLRYPVPRRRRRWGRVVAVLAASMIVVVGGAAVIRSAPDARASATSPPRPGSEAAATAPDGTAPADPTTGPGAAPGDGQPPVARAAVTGGGMVGAPVTFSSEGSADPDGGALSYRWNFGDGTFPPATDPAPTHVFDEAGTYAVTLTVTDPSGASASTKVTVEQSRPSGAVALVSPRIGIGQPGGTATTRVWYSGQAPRTAIVAKVCRRSIADPAFREGLDCSLMTEAVANGTETGSGWIDVEVFRGPEPGGDGAWGCFASGDAAPPGVERLTTCFVRITNNLGANTRDDREVAFTLG
jgi:hypothetical protein